MARITIKFAYGHDRDPIIAITRKREKYEPSINALMEYGWTNPPLIVITVEYRGGVHTHNINTLRHILKLPKASVVTYLRALHLTAIKSLTALILNKHKLETNIV